MKKSLRSQLLVAVVMLVIATVALTSASYAWFTAIANPEVTNIDLYVKAANTLMLSANDGTTVPAVKEVADWSASISKTDIAAKQELAFPSQLYNVSTLFNSSIETGESHNFYIAHHTALGAIDSYTAAAATDYSKFSLWVKSTKTGALYLDTASTVTSTDAAPGNLITTTVRVGFVPVIDVEGTPTEDWTRAVIWEPNSKTHLGTVYGGPGGTAKIVTDKAAYGTDASNINDQLTYDFQTDGTNVTDDATKISLLDIAAADTAYNFNVYIWVEGADDDTQSSIAKNTFVTYLRFGQM